MLLLIPLYAIVPSVDLLFFVQAFSIAMGAFAIYLTAKLLSGSEIVSACLGSAYLLYPSVQGMTLNMFLYGFHPKLALLSCFSLFIFLYRTKIRWLVCFRATRSCVRIHGSHSCRVGV